MPPIKSDRVLPTLFDRLAGGEASSSGADLYVSREQYLKSVRRDLLWLLKTDISRPAEIILRSSGNRHPTALDHERENTEPAASLADYPLASTSVLAFGFPLPRGSIQINSTDSDLKRMLEHDIRAYEPRLDPATLRIRVSRKTSEEEQAQDGAEVFVLSVEIQGKVRLNSVSRDLLLQAYYTPAFAQWRIKGVADGS